MMTTAAMTIGAGPLTSAGMPMTDPLPMSTLASLTGIGPIELTAALVGAVVVLAGVRLLVTRRVAGLAAAHPGCGELHLAA